MLCHTLKNILLLCVECFHTFFSFAGCERPALTEADGSQQTQAVLRWEAGGEQWLQHVVGKGQCNHGLVGRVNDQHGDPETQEPEGKKREEGGGMVRVMAGNKAVRLQHTDAEKLARRKHMTEVCGSRSTSLHLSRLSVYYC